MQTRADNNNYECFKVNYGLNFESTQRYTITFLRSLQGTKLQCGIASYVCTMLTLGVNVLIMSYFASTQTDHTVHSYCNKQKCKHRMH